MTSQAERDQESSAIKRAVYLARVCDGGLEASVERSGGILRGFSAKTAGYDVLLTLRAEFPGGRMICFVGGSTIQAALTKAYREANSDSLRWRADKWDKK